MGGEQSIAHLRPDLAGIVRLGWRGFKARFGLLVVCTIILLAASVLGYVITQMLAAEAAQPVTADERVHLVRLTFAVALLYRALVMLPLAAGFLWLAVRIARGEPATVSSLFLPFTRLLHLVAVSLLMKVLLAAVIGLPAAVGMVCLAFVVGATLESAAAIAAYSLFALLVGAAFLYGFARLLPAYLLVFDSANAHRSGPIASLAASWRMTRGRTMTLVAVLLLCSLVLLVTLLALVVPLFVVGYPLACAICGAAYALIVAHRPNDGERPRHALPGGPLGWSAVVILLSVATYLGLATYVARQSPRISFDAFERVDAMTPEAADGGAWPIYRETLPWHVMRILGEDPFAVVHSTTGYHDLPEWTIALNAARARGAEIAELRRAASTPRLGHRLTDPAETGESAVAEDAVPPPLFVAPMHHLELLNGARGPLVADVWAAVADEDGARAVDNLVALLGVARHAGEQRLLTGQLIETAVHAHAANEALALLSRAAEVLATEDLERLQRAFAAIDPAAWRLHFDVERIAVEDVAQRIFSDDGRGDGHFLADAFFDFEAALNAPLAPRSRRSLGAWIAGPVISAFAARRGETLAMADLLFEMIRREAEIPIAQRPRDFERTVDAISQAPIGVRYVLIRVWMPALKKICDGRMRTRAIVECAITAIALERRRRETGAWPEALVELVPSLLERIPVDAYRGEPLSYRISDEIPELDAGDHPGWRVTWSPGVAP